jgi:hypothetical protein
LRLSLLLRSLRLQLRRRRRRLLFSPLALVLWITPAKARRSGCGWVRK